MNGFQPKDDKKGFVRIRFLFASMIIMLDQSWTVRIDPGDQNMVNCRKFAVDDLDDDTGDRSSKCHDHSR